MMRVLFFGPVVDLVQMPETHVEFTSGMTLHDVIAHQGVQYPNAFGIVSFIAVHQVQIHDRQMELHNHDEIAFMAKFSGG